MPDDLLKQSLSAHGCGHISLAKSKAKGMSAGIQDLLSQRRFFTAHDFS
jgi:hypothetical protein